MLKYIREYAKKNKNLTLWRKVRMIKHSTAQHSTAQRLDKAFLTVYSEMSGINLNVAFFSVIVRKAVA